MDREEKVGKVLIIDDDRSIRHLIKRALEVAGFNTVEAEDGEKGLAVFDELKPDIVLLDVAMPGMDGFEVCECLRKIPGGKQTPVLMVTGHDDTESINRCYEVGATDFLSKPLNWWLLGHRVRYILRASRASVDLQASQEKLMKAQNMALLGWWEVDLSQDILICSEAAKSIFGIRPNLYDGTIESSLHWVHPDDREMVLAAIEGLDDTHDFFDLDHRAVTLDGEIHFVHHLCELSYDDTGNSRRLIGTVQDITKRHVAEQEAHFLTFYDKLTGLPNRKLFLDRFNFVIDQDKRHGRICALLAIDLDGLKRVNDTLGHKAGDQILKEVAQRMKQALRCNDVVGRYEQAGFSSFLARFVGDAFVILLSQISKPHDAIKVVERILDVIHAPFDIEGKEAFISAGIGIAIHPMDGEDTASILKNADTALHQAKSRGRKKYLFYANSMNQQAVERLSLESDLRHVLEREELILHYQPQIDINSGRPCGVEALLRWQHPERGLVPPCDFITLAEDTGLIIDIGNWVLQTACRQNKKWQEDGLQPIRMAVNVSANQFMEGDLPQRVEDALKNADMEPGLLEIEVTESILMEDKEESIRQLEEIKEMGVKIAIDDFGTGYSSLNYLASFPIDTLKIDRSFLKNIPHDEQHNSISKAIIAMAKGLGLEALAEGIENEEQLHFLQEQGSRNGQGFIFSKPLPAHIITELLRETENGIPRQWSLFFQSLMNKV